MENPFCAFSIYMKKDLLQMIFEMYDFEHSNAEERYIAIGKVGDVLFVVFTERGENIRLISARLATNLERGLYYGQDFYN